MTTIERELDGDPCKKCGGHGSITYSSTAVWRGGAGGQALTAGVCDSCWGSGCSERPWTDLRRMWNQLESLRADSERLRRAVELVREERLHALDNNRREKAEAFSIALDYMRGIRK